MADEPRSASRGGISEPDGYEPPEVEDLPAEDGTAVTGGDIIKSPLPPGAEWRA